MNEQRKAKIAELRKAMANMSDEEKQQLIDRGIVATVEGRALSPRNTVLLYFQFPNPSIVAGYQQWKNAGRQVKKGEHGLMIWVPSVKKGKEVEGKKEEDEMNFYTATVFDISQTEEIEA